MTFARDVCYFLSGAAFMTIVIVGESNVEGGLIALGLCIATALIGRVAEVRAAQ